MTGQLPLEAVARSGDPQTSWDAARSIEPSGSQEAVLKVLATVPWMTDEQLNDRLQGTYSSSRVRTARGELVQCGLVEWTGATSVLRSGRQGRTWQITDTRDFEPDEPVDPHAGFHGSNHYDINTDTP